jgi:LmbE family N-acetylglucosaminyl deacetylase
MALAGTALLPAQTPHRKLLIVVAHPDDEYAVAATTYRLARELGWVVDQVVITNGEAGYRYSALAQAIYGVSLTGEASGRKRLPAIRRRETLRAGKILGVRRHYFLGQKDSGFGSDASQASTSDWDRPRVLAFLSTLLERERYDVVFTLLPTPETHAHHRAATLLALQAAAGLPKDQRLLVLGAEAGTHGHEPSHFPGLAGKPPEPGEPLTRTTGIEPAFVFDRTKPFGYQNALNYQIVVNWMIAEHKSQGLFQTDYGRHDVERFWMFEAGGTAGLEALVEGLR